VIVAVCRANVSSKQLIRGAICGVIAGGANFLWYSGYIATDMPAEGGDPAALEPMTLLFFAILGMVVALPLDYIQT
jgi:hypothetical protein